MRLIHVLVPGDQRDSVLGALDDKDVEYVVLDAVGPSDERASPDGSDPSVEAELTDEAVLVEFPLPTDGVGDVMDALREAGLDDPTYSVIGAAETATTSTMEALEDRYAHDFDPLTVREVRSKARDMARDRTSFVWMIFLSALIATAGLLVDSPAVVVGSMVIAPMVGPVLTMGVGATTGDRRMFVDSVRLQVIGLVVAVGGATAFSFLLQSLAFFPPTLDIAAIDLISVRIAPNFSSVVVGVAAGGAAAFGLTTKGPTSLIGVMIAAALIPSAATAGIAFVWGYHVIAVGTLLLLLVTIVAINAAVLGTLWYLGYQSVGFEEGLFGGASAIDRTTLVVGAVALLAVGGVVVVGSYQQIAFERTVNQEVEDVIDGQEYGDLDVVTVRSEYTQEGNLLEPATVTVTVSRTSDRAHPELAGTIQRRLADATRQDPSVRLRFVDFETANASSS